MSLEVTEVAAIVSEAICALYPNYTRVARLLPEGTTAEMSTSSADAAAAASTAPVGLDIDGFWPKDCPLSDERKRDFFWQYNRAMGCHAYAAILATVLKDLCDNGVHLVHEEKPVVDILALNTLQYNVSDIVSAKDRVLRVRDPVTDTTLPIIATHETMERMYNKGGAFCYRLGVTLPEKGNKMWGTMKKHIPDAYKGTLSHYWVACVVEGEIGLSQTYEMVHLDVCGAAYDPSALVVSPRSKSLVSLQVFKTPEYEMVASRDPDMGHKLNLLTSLSERAAGGKNVISLQPKSVRHFHCYHNERSSVEATSLGTYIDRKPLSKEMNSKVGELVQSIQNDHLKHLPPGSKVIVRNIKSKPELNGRSGTITNATEKDKVASDRVPVLVDGLNKSIAMKLSCIQLPPQTRPYRTLKELQRSSLTPEQEKEIHKASEKKAAKVSKSQKAQINALLDDPAVSKVFLAMHSGQTGFTRYEDPEFKSGVGKLIEPPLCTMLPPEMLSMFRQTYELANHPKAGGAIKIINLYKAAKQRLLTDSPECVLPNGQVVVHPGSELARVQASVTKKIRGDAGLAEIFQKLDQLGLFANPAK